MAAGLPTPKQVETLRALDADPSAKVAAAVLRSLTARGWLREDGTGDLAVTPLGRTAVRERDAVETYQALPLQEQNRVFVTARHRSSGPKGRNVQCGTCHRAGRDRTVWFTNESGDPAQRSAEIAAAVHHARHASGELGPFTDPEPRP